MAETIIITKDKPHVFVKTVHRGDRIQSGKDVKIVIDKITGTPGAVVEANILAATSMDESVNQPGAYIYIYTPDDVGNFKARFYVDGEHYPEDDDVIKVTATDIDNVFSPVQPYLDFGTPQSFEQGALVVLDVYVYDYFGGNLVDADELPIVIIRDVNAVTKTNQVSVRLGLGHYKCEYRLADAALVGAWSMEWQITINSILLSAASRTEVFSVIQKTVISCGDTRSGYAFNNPDLGANDGWGAILTPDELRYYYMMGNDLVAPNFATISDNELKWTIDNAIGAVERDLNVKFQKRVYKYREKDGVTRDDLGALVPGVDFEWEEPYDFNAKTYREYIFIVLRKRPLLSVEKCLFRDVTGGNIIDLKGQGWMKPNYDKASLQFFPEAGSLASLPLTFGVAYDYFNSISARGDYPDAYFIDYTAGFESVRHMRKQWPELFDVIGKLAAISIMNTFGDGRSPGLASASISLSGISESYATTQSATNALYGARILTYTKELKEWFKNNKYKYAGIRIVGL